MDTIETTRRPNTPRRTVGAGRTDGETRPPFSTLEDAVAAVVRVRTELARMARVNADLAKAEERAGRDEAARIFGLLAAGNRQSLEIFEEEVAR